ncbi:MAG: hypothetical protein HKN57_04500 [Xanthomonadales bacterium]|nr:class I SAM-dependent methyltransferase [Gammaproteobacteria bacterium]MBT8053438.1 class I SAM-dependent methyltransferase [Gammaproteobacteria bacterium]NND56491.1 hypothetical protein [Xanthomonadales bacterium]NNK52200.1 hypothetical protein [Xanthomonadales bacterium]
MASIRNPDSDRAVLKQLSEGLLQSAGRTGVRGSLLEIHHPDAPCFEPVFLHTSSELFGQFVRLSQGDQNRLNRKVRCESAQLPFQDRVFQVVVLHHVVGDGFEPELEEAVRVLARDGLLILLGLNRMGWRFRAQKRKGRMPGMAPLRIKGRLEELQMSMHGFAGAGLCGLSRPVWMNSGLASLGAPLADVVLLEARHRNSPEVSSIQFRNSHTGVVQSAAMRG